MEFTRVNTKDARWKPPRIRPEADGPRSSTHDGLSDEFIARVNAWAARQDDRPTRSEAIRRLVEAGLKEKGKAS